jgi:hypothetical protein
MELNRGQLKSVMANIWMLPCPRLRENMALTENEKTEEEIVR